MFGWHTSKLIFVARKSPRVSSIQTSQSSLKRFKNPHVLLGVLYATGRMSSVVIQLIIWKIRNFHKYMSVDDKDSRWQLTKETIGEYRKKKRDLFILFITLTLCCPLALKFFLTKKIATLKFQHTVGCQIIMNSHIFVSFTLRVYLTQF